MNKYRLKARYGETIPLEVQWDTDITAQATLLVYNDEGTVYTKTVDFVDNSVTLNVDANDTKTIGVGDYKYLIRIDYASGEVDYLPDPMQCSGCVSSRRCVAPMLQICEAPR